ncbi:MAG: hypothetical protein V4677_12405 [Bacteroidota bacterium]
MKKYVFIVSALLAVIFTACKKDHVCVCTNSNTGHVSYGDKMKTNVLTKKAAEEACEANNDLAAGELENCHLE